MKAAYHLSPSWEKELLKLSDRDLDSLSATWLKPKLGTVKSFEIKSVSVDKLSGLAAASVRIVATDGRTDEKVFDAVLTDEGPRYRFRDLIIMMWTMEPFLEKATGPRNLETAKSWHRGVQRDAPLLSQHGMNGLVSRDLPARLIPWTEVQDQTEAIVRTFQQSKP